MHLCFRWTRLANHRHTCDLVLRVRRTVFPTLDGVLSAAVIDDKYCFSYVAVHGSVQP